jgi:hypothetical protein
MPRDETSESSCDGCDAGTARESERKFAGPDEFRDDDVVIWFSEPDLQKSDEQRATSRKGFRPFAFGSNRACNAGIGPRDSAELQMHS